MAIGDHFGRHRNSYRTNRIIGGSAPSEYLAKLEKGSSTAPAIPRAILDGYLVSHMFTPELLRADKFAEFMEDRQKRLLTMIEKATGKAAYAGPGDEEGETTEADEDATEAERTIAAA